MIKFSKTQHYILGSLADGEWHKESDLFCTRATLKALERKGAIEPHPSLRDSWHNKWRLRTQPRTDRPERSEGKL